MELKFTQELYTGIELSILLGHAQGKLSIIVGLSKCVLCTLQILQKPPFFCLFAIQSHLQSDITNFQQDIGERVRSMISLIT